VIKCVGDPSPEDTFTEEGVILAKLVQLWITIKHSSTDKLIKDANNHRGKHRKEDVVKGKRPRLEENLARKGIGKGELSGKISREPVFI